MYHKNVVVVASRHDDCGVPPGVPEMCVDMEFRSVPRTHEQAERVCSMELEIRLASAQGWSILHTPPETCQSISTSELAHYSATVKDEKHQEQNNWGVYLRRRVHIVEGPGLP